MSNANLIAFAWVAVAAHLGVGIAALRRLSTWPLVPLLNMVVALCVLAYWVPRWYAYMSKSITLYATDQLLPLYAIGVCVLSGLALAGRYDGGIPHWMIFALHTLVLVVAALFFTLFRMDRLI